MAFLLSMTCLRKAISYRWIAVSCLMATMVTNFRYTFKVGHVDQHIDSLLKTTLECLRKAISVAVAGHHVGDIGAAVSQCAREHGYGVVLGLGGHGIGRQMHEDPYIPNVGKKGRGALLQDGMCIAIEPMITMGKAEIGLLPDRWGIVTFDGQANSLIMSTPY